MKKRLFLTYPLVACFLFSCQQKPAETQTEQKPVEQPAQATAQTKDMQSFAQQKGCFACHDISTKKVGPAFKDVAKKFAGEKDAEVHLAERIKKGGVGEWGNVPMPPQNVTEQEAKDLAKWVLGLK
ncbi:MAG: c-type cytochrome [Aquificaceae bacterium]|nr:c-type cytochrome [Aquificaceae bacterium]MDW8293731.1 c-type cytochrome [Aquificaceae bacterium]